MWTVDRPPQWVGRGQELTVLQAGVEALGRGEGAVVWVEGEPGIGKSSLVAEALPAGGAPGWDIGWELAAPPSSSSMTCNGPTTRRSSSGISSPRPSASCGCC